MTTPAPKGFRFATAAAGFRKSGRKDIALVVSDVPAAAAGTFTLNAFPAAPVLVCRERLAARPEARGVLINVGQANACTGEQGVRNCLAAVEQTAEAVGLNPADILPGSTGVIGPHLRMDLWQAVIPALAADLGRSGPEDFAEAIRTTDAFAKFAFERLERPGGVVTVTGMAKGAGMICPDMATMLCVVLCDAAVEPGLWGELLREAVAKTFNRVSVDGDTSTNDSLFGLANGCSGAVFDRTNVRPLAEALERVLGRLAYMLVQDGEGSSKVAEIVVQGARSEADAECVARTVGHSQLVKTALYGRDANWGRIVAAVGRSGADFDPEAVRVSLCGVELFRDGRPTDVDFDALLAEPLAQRDIRIDITLGNGPGAYRLLASDLGHEYVDVNASYRS